MGKNSEEIELKKKLELLEKRYNENLFEESDIPSPMEPSKFGESKSDEKHRAIEKPKVMKKQKIVKKSEIIEKPKIVKNPLLVELPPIEKPKILKKPKIVKKLLSPKKGILKLKKKVLEKRDSAGKISHLEIKKSAEKIHNLRIEIAKVLVGQEEIVSGLIMGLLCNAHVLVEGVPGIAKTLAIRALASASGCTVKRIQFTVDMLPTDIIGVTSYTPGKGFEVIKGPIFANFLIADEINRAPPKTQSALIEGMQEKQVTIGRKRFPLPNPFFVMATENPIENAGVYPLPEAQIDRFLFKLIMGYPEYDEEKKVMDTNISTQRFEDYGLKSVITPRDITQLQELVKKVYLDENIKDYILKIVTKTREKDFESAKYISYGCSPRASIGLFIASKANALMNGRDYVLPEDVKEIAPMVLRHRLLLSYKANIEKISADGIVKEILNSISIE